MENTNITNAMTEMVDELKSSFKTALDEIQEISAASDQYRTDKVEKYISDLFEHTKQVEINVQKYCDDVTAQVKSTELANQTRADNIINSNRLLALATLYTTIRDENEAIAMLYILENKL
jgi:hypothetical protein